MDKKGCFEESIKEIWKNEDKKRLTDIAKKGFLIATTVLTVAGGMFLGYNWNSAKPEQDIPAESYVPGEMIVNVRDISDLTYENGDYYLPNGWEAEQIFPNIKDEELSEYFVVKVPDSILGYISLEKVIEEYKSNASWIDSVTPNYYMYLPEGERVTYLEEPTLISSVIPNDPFFSTSGSWGQKFKDMYGLHNIHASDAWEITKGDDRVVIAVVDTGVDYNHEDIKDRMWKNIDEIANDGIDNDRNGFIDDLMGYNFIDDTEDPMDDQGHGTHVAGTIAATTNNKIGVAGINWYGKIMPVKVLNKSGSGTWESVAKGIVYAADNGAWVMNMSLGGRANPKYQPIIDAAITYADSKGTIIVVAAGNSNEDAMKYTPANNPLVLTIAATDYYDKKASFSNWGEKVDVGAPGVDVLSLRASQSRRPPVKDQPYTVMSGTSMASPHVAGEVALILGANPALHGQREAVRTIVRKGVDEYQTRPSKPIGTGRINLEVAVKLAKEWK